MTDRERLSELLMRLARLESLAVDPWEKPIHDVARLAIEAEITQIGQRLGRRDYWRRRPQE